MWTKLNIPLFRSERVQIKDEILPSSDDRYYRHAFSIFVDSEKVWSVFYIEDTDFPSCSDQEPNAREEWDK